MRTNLVLFGLLLALLAGIGAMFASVTTAVPFAYDEADYMYAGTRGFAANYLDSPSQSLPEFVSKGMELARDKNRRVGMSEYIRSTGDITFYRHFHGPIYAFWIAANRALGVNGERAYRASGLIIHAAGAIAIFWLFRLIFPELGALTAWVAAFVFATNRTALVTGMAITQHVVFAFLAVLSLLILALFAKTGRMRYWYGTTAMLAVSFASVEISTVLLTVVVLTLIALRWRDGWKKLAILIGKGTAVFLVTLMVIWPKGVLEAGAAKGYLYLAYMAISRKTFSPIGPLELWRYKLATYPWEWWVLVVSLLGVMICFRRLQYRAETLPFVLYVVVFAGVTTVITVPYTYYHCSMVICAAVITGVAFGEIWKRYGVAARVAALAAILACSLFSDVGYYRESKRAAETPSPAAGVLAHFRVQEPTDALVPYIYVPPLHYYFPEIKTTGFDNDWTISRLAAAASDAPRGSEVVCPEPLCQALERELSIGSMANKVRLPPLVDAQDQLWAYQLR